MSYEPHQRTPLSSLTFDEHSTRYRLCCCHVKTWAWVIGILELISMIINLGSGIGGYASGGAARTVGSYGNTLLSGMIGGILGFIISIIILILYFYGLKKERAGFLIPHLVFQIIGIVLLIIAAIGYFVLAGTVGSGKMTYKDPTTGKYYNADAATGGLVGIGVVMVVAAIIEIFFFYAVYRAYRYLKDKFLSGEPLSHVPMGASHGYSSTEKGKHIP